MRRVGEALQNADRDAFDTVRLETLDKRLHRVLVERGDDAALSIDPLRHDIAIAAWHQRWRQIDIDVVLLEAVLVADLDGVAKSLGGDKSGPGAFAFDDRVGGEGRAVDDDRKIAWAEP